MTMVLDLKQVKHSGFCDRLRFITFGLAAASHNKERSISVKDYQTQECPYRFLDLLTVNGFDVTDWRETDGQGESWQASWTNERPSIQGVKNNKPSDIVWSDQDFLRQWMLAYQLLQPSQDIQFTVRSLGVDDSFLGFHIRRTDKIETKRRTPLGVTPKRCVDLERRSGDMAKAALKRLGLNKIFLAADNEEAKMVWMKRFSELGVSVKTHDARFYPDRFRQTDGRDLVVDLFSLARCRFVVGSVISQVVRTAGLIAGDNEARYAFAQKTPSGVERRALVLKSKISFWVKRALK